MSVFSRFFHSRDKPEELRRAQDTLGGSRFPFFFGGPQTFLGQFFWSVAERFGQFCSVMAFSCFDVLQRLPS